MSLVEVLIALLFAGLVSATLGSAIAANTASLLKGERQFAQDSVAAAQFAADLPSFCAEESLHQFHLFRCQRTEERSVRTMLFLSE